MNYSKERLGNVYSVHNNLPYAEPMANGSSKQACGPAGCKASLKTCKVECEKQPTT
jgi:hypothetical protein